MNGVIYGFIWYRNSQNKGGNSIDFLVDYYGMSPKEAIDTLVQTYAGQTSEKNIGVKEKNWKRARLIYANLTLMLFFITQPAAGSSIPVE